MKRIAERRRLRHCILLGILTLGIYLIPFWQTLSRDINVMLKGDGKCTRGVLWRMLLFIPTFGIYGLVWHYRTGKRLQHGLHARGILYDVGGALQVLLCLCGLYVIADYLLIHATNRLAQYYNAKRA